MIFPGNEAKEKTNVDRILSGRHDEIWAVREIEVYVSLEGEGEMEA